MLINIKSEMNGFLSLSKDITPLIPYIFERDF